LSADYALQLALDLIEQQVRPPERSWRQLARPKQLPPGGDWNIWLAVAGRGWGKTWVGSNWIAEQALKYPGTEWAVLAPTFRDTRVVCFEGSSGLLTALGKSRTDDRYRRNELQINLSNGSVIYGYSADQPERIRGANLAGAWADELCSWRYPASWYEGLVPALRSPLVERPRVVVTTTPRPTALIKDLLGRGDGTVHVTRGSTWENAANLSAAALDELRRRYEGTRLGRQELEGELLEDVEGALWNRTDIDAARVRAEPDDLTRVVVAIDPAVTSGAESDETGIIVAGEGPGGHGYVLADYSMRGTPDACMRKAVYAYRRHEADCIVAEVNNGGDYLGAVLRAVDPDVPYRQVRASRGKAVRAEPVAALYEQRRVHHVGCFPDLEDQMCGFVPGESGGHDDRMDAAVYAVTELRGLSAGSYADVYGEMGRCGSCGGPFLRRVDGRPRVACPHCRQPVDEAA
jgi:phage terminase large subunit-like protein